MFFLLSSFSAKRCTTMDLWRNLLGQRDLRTAHELQFRLCRSRHPQVRQPMEEPQLADSSGQYHCQRWRPHRGCPSHSYRGQRPHLAFERGELLRRQPCTHPLRRLVGLHHRARQCYRSSCWLPYAGLSLR